MPYNIIMNVTFLLSVLGVIFMVLRRLPEATELSREKAQEQPTLSDDHSVLSDKGLPVKESSKFKQLALKIWHKISQFLLEAKGLRHSPKIHYNFQKVFSKPQSDVKAVAVKNEKYYIDLIKRNPKDYSYYDMLGQYYLGEQKMTDAISVYEYLVDHVPTQVMFWVRLGLAALHLKEWEKAEHAYAKALDLDQSHPSRFYNLALALQGLGKYSEAVKALDKALELEPKNQKYFDLRFEMESKAKSAVPLENIHKSE